MSDGINAAPLRLGELFADPYVIESPPYQRPYSWTEEEASKLLEDISGSMQESGGAQGYFLAFMLLMEVEPDQAGVDDRFFDSLPRRFDVVDGQQRLITLTILFAILRDLEAKDGAEPDPALVGACAVNEEGTSASYRVRPRGQDAKVMAAYVQPLGATLLDVGKAEYVVSAQRLLNVRAYLVDALSPLSAGARAKLKQYLLHQCSLVVVKARDIDRAHQIFSALNGRGKPLDRNDILKVEILRAQTPESAERSVAIWDRAAEVMGENFEQFFSHLADAEASGGGQIIKSLRTIIKKQGSAEAFVKNVFEPYAAIYGTMLRANHEGTPQSPEINRYLTYLSWLKGSEWIPPVLAWWRRCGGDSAQVLWFLRAVDRLAYGCHIVTIGNSRRGTRFGAITTAIRRGEKLGPDHELLALSRDERGQIEYNLRDLHKRNPQICKLVLARLADERRGQISTEIDKKWTIEHILPKNPTAKDAWVSWHPNVAERTKLMGAIGNLILLPEALNDQARNYEFARKQAIYSKATHPVHRALLADVLDRQTWSAAEIQARTREFLELIERIWAFDESKRTAPMQAVPASQLPPSLQTRAQPPSVAQPQLLSQVPPPPPQPQPQPATRSRLFGFGRR